MEQAATAQTPTASVGKATEYVLINTPEKLEWLKSELAALPDKHVVGMDHETSGLYWINDRVTGTGLSWKEGQAVYLPHLHVDRDQWGFGYQDNVAIMRMLKRFRIVCHKAVFDTSHTWCTFGVALDMWDDTLLLARLLEKPGSLDDIMEREFGHGKPVTFKELMAQKFGRMWRSQGRTMADMTAEEAFLYCCRDADFCRRVYFIYKPLVLASKALSGLHKIEVNLLPSVRKMNCRGVPIDADLAQHLANLLSRQNDALLAEIRREAGFEINLNSHPQVQKLLFEDMRMPVLARSKDTGKPSAAAEVLEQLSDQYPITGKILKWREDTYAWKTYFAGLPTMADKEGRVHSEFDSVGAVTGRFTSGGVESKELTTDPEAKTEYRNWGGNLQNISNAGVNFDGEALVLKEWPTPVEPGPDGKYDFLTLHQAGVVPPPPPLDADGNVLPGWEPPGEVMPVQVHYDVMARELFVAPEGYVWVKADLSQIEYRLLASLSQEQFLLDGFRAGHDYHRITAALFLDTPLDQVTKEQRKTGKTLNFAIAYGGGPEKIAKLLGIGVEEARQKLDAYWSRLQKVKALEAYCHQKALKEKNAKTFFGRVRTFEFPPQLNAAARDHILRQAYNHLVQGTAAEILKMGMLRAVQMLKPFGKDVELILQVHDELDFLVRKELVEEVCPVIRRALEVPTPPEWVPVVCEVSTGSNWSERNQKAWKAPEGYAPEPWESWRKALPVEVEPHAEV